MTSIQQLRATCVDRELERLYGMYLEQCVVNAV